MPESGDGVYERQWDARAYLRQYYSTPMTGDEAANTRFAARELRALGRQFENALEFGCGPTVHHAAPFAPYARQFTLADYLPENLAEVRRWLAAEPEAFDWNTWLAGMLALEAESGGADKGSLAAGAGATTDSALAARTALMRRITAAFKHGDIRLRHPLADGTDYDLVASYYCLECVGLDRAEWAECLANLCRLVRPGGVLFLGAVRRARFYHVFDREFPVSLIDENDFAAELPRLGFPANGLRIEVAPVPEFAAQGFESICCVRAVKDR
jgi:SAM-dependent methyltransferase